MFLMGIMQKTGSNNCIAFILNMVFTIFYVLHHKTGHI